MTRKIVRCTIELEYPEAFLNEIEETENMSDSELIKAASGLFIEGVHELTYMDSDDERIQEYLQFKIVEEKS